MARTAGIGIQDFETIISNNYFYYKKKVMRQDWQRRAYPSKKYASTVLHLKVRKF